MEPDIVRDKRLEQVGVLIRNHRENFADSDEARLEHDTYFKYVVGVALFACGV
jgi:hypothetical protein